MRQLSWFSNVSSSNVSVNLQKGDIWASDTYNIPSNTWNLAHSSLTIDRVMIAPSQSNRIEGLAILKRLSRFSPD